MTKETEEKIIELLTFYLEKSRQRESQLKADAHRRDVKERNDTAHRSTTTDTLTESVKRLELLVSELKKK